MAAVTRSSNRRYTTKVPYSRKSPSKFLVGTRPCAARYWTGCLKRQHGRCCVAHRILSISLSHFALYSSAHNGHIPTKLIYDSLFIIHPTPTDSLLGLEWAHANNINVSITSDGQTIVEMRYCAYCHRLNPYVASKCTARCYTQSHFVGKQPKATSSLQSGTPIATNSTSHVIKRSDIESSSNWLSWPAAASVSSADLEIEDE